MSDLENRHAKPLLTPLVFSDRGPLVPHEFDFDGQYAIAAWTFMKAVVMDHAVQHRRHRFFSIGQRERFYSLRLLPASAEVWAARLVSDFDHFRSVVVYHRPRFLARLRGTEVLVFTCALNNFVLQLTSIRRTARAGKNKGPSLTLPVHPTWTDAVVRLYPPDNIVIWPPRLAIDHPAGLDAFVTRWSKVRL